jgi:hypothetical protein
MPPRGGAALARRDRADVEDQHAPVRETLQELDPRYPEVTLDAAALRERLAPPN